MGIHFSGKKVPQMAKLFHLKNITVNLTPTFAPFLDKNV